MARDNSNGGRVLVHIFESPEAMPVQPTIEWILQSFRRVAPDPPASLVEAGPYNATGYIYLVTKFPDSAATLQAWVNAYKSYGQPGQKATPPETPIGQISSGQQNQPVRSGDRFSERPVQSQPGEFTRAFLAKESRPIGANSGSRDPVSPERKVPVTSSPEPGSFTQLFQSSLPDRGLEDDADRGDPNRSAGEFTRFFRGPFDGQQGTATPDLNQSVEPISAAGPGEFTRVFGSGRNNSQGESTPSRNLVPDPPSQREPGGFTSLFSASHPQGNVPAGPESHNRPFDGTEERNPILNHEPVWSEKPSAASDAPPRPIFPSHDPVRTLPGSSLPEVSPYSPPRSRENASRVFSVNEPSPELAPAPREPAVPGEYTRIVSGGKKSAPTPEEPPIQPQAPPMPLGQFNMGIPTGMPVAAPQTPAIPQAPPAPQFPQPMQAPPAPQMSAMPAAVPLPPIATPRLPAIRKDETTASGPPAYWPLVLILSGLFILAVLLVVFFAIRH